MRKCITYIILTAALLSLGGCDFLRRMAGRPTSADIEAKRELILQDSLKRQAIADSLERVRQARLAYEADSVAVMDTISRLGIIVKSVSDVSSLKNVSFPARYWLVTGAFRSESNASRLVSRLEQLGFECRSVKSRRGLTTVLAAPNVTVRGLFDDYKRYAASDQFNPQVWILDTAAPVQEN